MIGVLMRIISFTLVSWLGAYTLLNSFWILVGGMGLLEHWVTFAHIFQNHIHK